MSLVDARNWTQMKPRLIDGIRKSTFTGFDIETHNADAHEGIKTYGGKKLIFDVNRTTVCGFSVSFDGETADYVNLAHTDVANRVPWLEAKEVLDARNPSGYFICHNAPFELTMMGNSLAYELERVICTLQMCAAAFGPDEYPEDKFLSSDLGAMKQLMPDAAKLFWNYERGTEMTPEQSELFYQVVAKESDANWSWNGVVDEMAFGYSLKKIVKSLFGYRMMTYEECLRGREHMGQLTGEEVAAYGGDDSLWAVKLFHRLLQFMTQTHEPAIKAFFEQENPMIHVYSDIWRRGMRINTENVLKRRETERANYAAVLRKLRAALKQLLPFPTEFNAKLASRDKWYATGHPKYRAKVANWAMQPDKTSDYEQAMQASGAVSKGWYEGTAKLLGPNFTHYMMMRTVLYDLLRQKPFAMDGKTQSDAEARGKLMERIEKQLKEDGADTARLQTSLEVVKAIGEMAGIEQRMKLYLTPYSKLMDPETGRMYPVVSSRLASRRMASSFPNPMQLAKQGESTYIRGFYLPDNDEHLIVSIDWSQIELVLIGDFSGDPEFKKAYGQLPYEDLHAVAVADILTAETGAEVTVDTFKKLRTFPDNYGEPICMGIPLRDHKGNKLTPSACYKYNRGTDGGKGANFNYWYSGALSSIGTKRGWSSQMMWDATDRYRNRFAVAEKWRMQLIEHGRSDGVVELPDGLRRVKFEATYQFLNLMAQKFERYNNDGVLNFGRAVCNKLHRRAGNQLVNSKVQGSCATLAKRSVLSINKEIKGQGFDARFLIPIHDELVFSVNRREIVPFIKMAKPIMCNHPEIIKDLVITSSASVGRTFEPWHATKAPIGQIEIDEAPALLDLPAGKALNDNQVEQVIDYLRRAA